MITIHVTNQQTKLPIDESRLKRAVRRILEEAPIDEAQISLAVVDDPTIRRLNREFLNRDHATDVLSFELERSGRSLEAEVIVSADTARATASRFGWSAADELLLYVIHGTLHLVGCDDQTPEDLARMRDRERAHLARFGLQPHNQEYNDRNHDPRTAVPSVGHANAPPSHRRGMGMPHRMGRRAGSSDGGIEIS